ncbi:hypothetical protein CDL12_05333 [Handroanthus impetiginosus]|uniref:Protein NO VEIN C-terminal domain-containing protein n=1 Tax=Handroanthus impetiginosus TaxID=429701 RepID=A0A2G9HWQ8_9LAMI|nr:hypothetical protein CDL12_05333 [Handroanthus impetiginosus]
MITTMAESGATEEQTEFFILNSQKVPKLPAEESSWSLQSVSSSMESNDAQAVNCLSPNIEEQNSSGFKRKCGIDSNWPPADWKTAPGFNSTSVFGSKNTGVNSMHITGGNIGGKEHEQNNISPTHINTEFDIEVKSTAITQGAVLLEAEISESQNNISGNLVTSGSNVALDSVDLVAPNSKHIDCSENDEALAQQALLTGRLGELVAFRYFSEKGRDMFVKWVNETNETGLPYDIILGSDESSREYIEVKATKSGRKNWFLISMREWQFAIEKGESFSIAHVVLADNDMARITIYKNPAALCQLGNLKLAVVVPKQQGVALPGNTFRR